LNSKT
jgi:hypothetical protein